MRRYAVRPCEAALWEVVCNDACVARFGSRAAAESLAEQLAQLDQAAGRTVDTSEVWVVASNDAEVTSKTA